MSSEENEMRWCERIASHLADDGKEFDHRNAAETEAKPLKKGESISISSLVSFSLTSVSS